MSFVLVASAAPSIYPCGFERACLAPGEFRRVSFTVPAVRLEFVDRAFRRIVEPGVCDVMVGHSSAATDLRDSSR